MKESVSGDLSKEKEQENIQLIIKFLVNDENKLAKSFYLSK